MISPQATLVFQAAIPLLTKLVWPVFLLIFWGRKDVQKHVRFILENHRLEKIKVPGGHLIFVTDKERVKKLPEREPEIERIPASKPRRRQPGI